MNVDRREAICLCVLSVDHPFTINILKIVFYAYGAFAKSEVELPSSERNQLQLLSNKELQL